MTTILYALKCDEGYIRQVEKSLKIVDMQKASVFENVDDMRLLFKSASEIKGIHPVELTIIERKIN